MSYSGGVVCLNEYGRKFGDISCTRIIKYGGTMNTEKIPFSAIYRVPAIWQIPEKNLSNICELSKENSVTFSFFKVKLTYYVVSIEKGFLTHKSYYNTSLKLSLTRGTSLWPPVSRLVA